MEEDGAGSKAGSLSFASLLSSFRTEKYYRPGIPGQVDTHNLQRFLLPFPTRLVVRHIYRTSVMFFLQRQGIICFLLKLFLSCGSSFLFRATSYPALILLVSGSGAQAAEAGL